MELLREWESFYVIVGSSAGALIGLQFVVLTLIAELPVNRGDEQAGEAFATPTIVHLGSVLFLSGVLSAPWHVVLPAAIIVALAGIAGLIYTLLVIRRQRRQTAYEPVFEDVLFHAILPLATFLMVAISAFFMQSHERGALFTVAAAALLLLFIAIHNAWDSVSYVVFVKKRTAQEAERNGSGNS